MYKVEPFSLQIRYLKEKKYFFFWTSFLISVFILFVWFASSYLITNYETYQGVVVKQENEYFVKLYITQNQTPTFVHSELMIEKQSRNFEVLAITNPYELGLMSGYVELTLKMDLQKSEKIDNNLLEITSIESKQTLFQKWKNFFLERVRL